MNSETFTFSIVSVKALAWAFDLEIFPSSKKFVLVALCNYCGDNGTTYPGLGTLCRMTELSEDTVARSLDALVADGVIADTGKKAGDTGRVKVYQLPEEVCLIRKIKSPHGAEIKSPHNPRTIPAQSPHNPRTIPESCGSPIYKEPLTMNHEPVPDGGVSSNGKGFPVTLEDALDQCGLTAAPREFVEHCYDLAASRGGKDSKSNPIEDFPAYVRFSLKCERSRMGEKSLNGNSPKPVQIGPSKSSVYGRIIEKWPEEFRRITKWTNSFYGFWSDPAREWKRNGKLIDWEIELSAQVSKWRTET